MRKSKWVNIFPRGEKKEYLSCHHLGLEVLVVSMEFIVDVSCLKVGKLSAEVPCNRYFGLSN